MQCMLCKDNEISLFVPTRELDSHTHASFTLIDFIKHLIFESEVKDITTVSHSLLQFIQLPLKFPTNMYTAMDYDTRSNKLQ